MTNRFESRSKAAPFSVRPFTTKQLAATASFDVYDFLNDRLGFVRCPSGGQPFARVQGVAVTGQNNVCIKRRGGWVAPRIFVDDAPWMGDVESLRGWSKGDIHRIEVVQHGTQIWVFTHAFAERLAKGQAQFQPFIIVR